MLSHLYTNAWASIQSWAAANPYDDGFFICSCCETHRCENGFVCRHCVVCFSPRHTHTISTWWPFNYFFLSHKALNPLIWNPLIEMHLSLDVQRNYYLHQRARDIYYSRFMFCLFSQAFSRFSDAMKFNHLMSKINVLCGGRNCPISNVKINWRCDIKR